MDQVFNELSLSASLPNNHAAHVALLNLIKASDKLTALNFSSQIRVTEDFANRNIIPGCTINEYLHRPVGGQERTLHQLLLKRFSSAPYVEELCDNEGMTVLEEYVIGKDRCKGLALAFLWNIPALSLAGDARFKPPYVTLTRNSLNADETFSEEDCRVGIICEEKDIKPHVEKIKDLLLVPTTTGKELLDYAQQHLRCLIFSSEAEDQLTKMPRGYILLQRIRSILEELQRAMQEALDTHQTFSPKGFKYTPSESDTATQGKNGQKHIFTFKTEGSQGDCSQSIELLCESHMHISDSNRIYFSINTSQTMQKVYIGHIGRHLPGKEFR